MALFLVGRQANGIYKMSSPSLRGAQAVRSVDFCLIGTVLDVRDKASWLRGFILVSGNWPIHHDGRLRFSNLK